MKKHIMGLLLLASVFFTKSHSSDSIPENNESGMNQILPNDLPSAEIVLRAPRGSFYANVIATIRNTNRLLDEMTQAYGSDPVRFAQIPYQIKTIEPLKLELYRKDLDSKDFFPFLQQYCRFMNIMEFNFKVMFDGVQR